jgi:hypothetical protein
MADEEVLPVKDDSDLYDEICAVAHHLNERSGRIEGRDHDNWIEAESIVRTLRKIAGDDGKRYILVNVPDDYRKFYRHLLQEVII